MSLEPNRVSMMECFCENTFNFCKKCLVIDVRLGSQYASVKVFIISNIRKFCEKTLSQNFSQTQSAFSCLKLTIETLEQGVKYVQS